jgi:peptidoglycan/xylan/chitin deacetylase (PgdA/CDA1 family)
MKSKPATSACRLLPALLVLGCITGNAGTRPQPGEAGAGGAGPGGAPGAAIVMGKHGLPIPAGGPVAQPTGTVGNLRVLDWAGFKAAVSWTFDDGQPSHIAHYADLQATGVPMTFYINDGHKDLANFDATWTQAAKDGHELGNHTSRHCHADLSGCLFGGSGGTLANEIDQCTAYITQHYPQSGVWTIAAPFGDGGWATIASTRFLVNRGVGAGLIAPNDNTDPFYLPSYVIAEGETARNFKRETDKAHRQGKWLIFLVHTLTPTDANGYAPVAIGAVTGGMSYGRSLGDVWMATVVDVAAYWIGQKLLTSATFAVSGNDATWTWRLPNAFPPGKYLRVTVDGGVVSQRGVPVAWDEHGFYEIALDAGSLTISP